MATDTRYVYGASCTWHGPIADIGRKTVPVRPNGFVASLGQPSTPMTLPCCPVCEGMLFECPHPDMWWGRVDKVGPNYRAFIEWLGNKDNHFFDYQSAKGSWYSRGGAKLETDK